MGRNMAILEDHLRMLSVGYPISVSDDYNWLRVNHFLLPPGHDRSRTDILVEVPHDYPLSPPGVRAHMYLPRSLRFQGRKLKDLHPWITPGWGDWAQMCFEWIRWNPHRDDLIGFMDMVRLDLTNPETLGG